MTKLVTAILLLCLMLKSSAQTNSSKKDFGLIIGNVLDVQTGKPIAFATLVLIKK